ncbi:hypothetical protein CRENBAI_024048 [Crenichthys baileyi]|uniref:Uncharacterized protein n=1 Tax=Crenichthys baileyi TaxID=28760 RepID=A0AAV9RFM8_9TELE
MSVLPSLSWTLLVLVQIQSSGSSSDLPSRLQPLSLTVHSLPDASSAHCPSCALARMRRNEGATAADDDLLSHEEEKAAQQDVVEAVKRHILNMLHLQARPNITRPVPRAALLNALRKLHVGRVAEDGSVQIEGEEEVRGRGGQGGGRGEERRQQELGRETAATCRRRRRSSPSPRLNVSLTDGSSGA